MTHRSLARIVSIVVAAGGLTVCASTASAVPVTLSQSTNNTITSLNSATCNSGAYSTENSWYRFFDLDGDHGITTSFTVSSVAFGIEAANDAAGLGQPVSVRLYALSGAPVLANLTLIGSQNLTVMDSESGNLRTVSVSGTIANPAAADLGVEVFAPDGVASNNYFSIGSNSSPESHPSYFRAPACAQPDITTAAAAGVPNHHMVLSVTGDGPAPAQGNPTPTPTQPQPKRKCKKKGKRRSAAVAKKCKRKKR